MIAGAGIIIIPAPAMYLLVYSYLQNTALSQYIGGFDPRYVNYARISRLVQVYKKRFSCLHEETLFIYLVKCNASSNSFYSSLTNLLIRSQS